MQIESVNLGQRLALTTDQQIVPITNLIDEFGDDTDEPSEADQFVAGPLKCGTWLTESTSSFEFENAQVH